LYGYADVGAFGLAHSLLAWARCRIWCNGHQFPMLAPSWRRVRLGPYLRREMDKRQYQQLFQFQDYVHGPRRLWLLATLRRTSAEQAAIDRPASIPGRQLVVFRNGESFSDNEALYFPQVVGHSEEIHRELSQMTRPEYRPARPNCPHLALHVRMGDFSARTDLEAVRQGLTNSRLPIQWYVDMLKATRARLGADIPARLYSDGRDSDLQPLMTEPNLTRVAGQRSVTDLLSIAQASVLISSGSGFSYWGSFLGQVPRLCFPGQRLVQAVRPVQGVELEPECETADQIPEPFLRVIEERVRTW